MTNRDKLHVFVLPEDDANRQLANGFERETSPNWNAIQVLPAAGGWTKVRDAFKNNHISAMSTYQKRHMVLLVDFDNVDNRRAEVEEVIPDSLAERVFVLGVLSKPEDLRKAGLGNFEEIGRNLARDCRENTTITWSHELLQHNVEVLQRMTPILKPILFPSA